MARNELNKEEHMKLTKLLRSRRGQSATEYMLVIAVVVIGLVAAASHFIPTFNDAIRDLGQNVSGWVVHNQDMANADGR